MESAGSSKDEIRQRVRPTLDRFAVKALRAWLKTIGLSSAATTRAAVTDLIVNHIAEKKLTEPALESALIGFEEASDMRIYLFRMEDGPSGDPEEWVPNRLKAMGIPFSEARVFAGDRTKPMSPVYAKLEGGLLRVKWAEQQQHAKLDDATDKVITVPVYKRIVLLADFLKGTAELRLNPPENRHAYDDASGRPTADAYYNAYIKKAAELLNCTLKPSELREVVKNLVEEKAPHTVRIHIDHHTNQKDTRSKTVSTRDVRDDPDWRIIFKENGATWAFDSQSFYWLPGRSAGFLSRELFTQINAEEGYVKVNADCSDDEVTYVISQIRARQAA